MSTTPEPPAADRTWSKFADADVPTEPTPKKCCKADSIGQLWDAFRELSVLLSDVHPRLAQIEKRLEYLTERDEQRF